MPSVSLSTPAWHVPGYDCGAALHFLDLVLLLVAWSALRPCGDVRRVGLWMLPCAHCDAIAPSDCVPLQPEITTIVVKNIIFAASRALEGPFSDTALAVLKECLDASHFFYSRVGHTPAALANVVYTEASPDWYSTLQIASVVDAQRTHQNNVKTWGRAVIMDEAGGKFQVGFQLPGAPTPYYTMWVPKNSTDLAPPGTKAHEIDDKFINSLKPMMRLDCEDKNRKFYNATVMDVRVLHNGLKEVCPPLLGAHSRTL